MADRLKGPVIPGTVRDGGLLNGLLLWPDSSLLDPSFEDCDLCITQRIVGRHFKAVFASNGLEKQTRLHVTGNNGRPRVSAFEQ